MTIPSTPAGAIDTAASAFDGTPGPALADDLAFIISLAERAGALLMERYEDVGRIDHKSARDVVTEVDHLSEALILSAIRQRYPADGILAEESGSHRAGAGAGAEPAAGRGRAWVVDPIDGTINYANGIPVFCVSIALVVDGRPAAGAVHDPTRAETFAATRGGPALLNGRVIRVSAKEQLSDYVVSLALGRRQTSMRWRRIRRQIRVARSFGSSSLALAYVARSRFDAFVQEGGLSTWDIAAAGLIAERAGAVVTDPTGGEWFDISKGTRELGVVAAPPAHHARLLEMLR